jgi:hypothetical protein
VEPRKEEERRQDGDEWSASRHCRFDPREVTTGIRWLGSWMGPRNGLDAVTKGKNSVLCNIKEYLIISLPVVLYECETWSVTLREGYKLKVHDNKLLRKIFGPRLQQ